MARHDPLTLPGGPARVVVRIVVVLTGLAPPQFDHADSRRRLSQRVFAFHPPADGAADWPVYADGDPLLQKAQAARQKAVKCLTQTKQLFHRACLWLLPHGPAVDARAV